jgi:hypothetical protein
MTTKVTIQEIYDMVSAIVQQADYDIWKDIFLYDEEESEEDINIVDIASAHLKAFGIEIDYETDVKRDSD